jgi:hypothetical protein
MVLLKEMRKNYVFQNESMEYKQKEIYALGGLMSYWNTMAKNLIIMLQNSIGKYGNCNIDHYHESLHSELFGDLDRLDPIVDNNLCCDWKNNKYQISHAPAFIARGGLEWTITSHMADSDGPPHMKPPTLHQYDAVIDMDVQLLKTAPQRVKPSAPGETGWSMRVHWAKQGLLPNGGGEDGCEPEHYEEYQTEEAEVDKQEWKRVRVLS